MEQLLTTKLFIPPTRADLVPRRRLIERLNGGILSGSKLVLISAPAGYGKTTLVSAWVAGLKLEADPPSNHQGDTIQNLQPEFAWLSLDENDNELTRFLTYFIAALRTIEPSLAKGALNSLQSPQPPPANAILTSLINDIAAVSGCIILVLDDYHHIESSPIDEALTFLLERLPPQLHLVVVTRVDPQLPVSRLRARGQLTELRAEALRFSTSEASDFLNQAMGLGLSAEDIVALENRTEGWIAGLQLAAISLQGKGNRSKLIQSFTGSHRLVLDYLIEEVINQQPQKIQTFLLHTAILSRLSGSLCDSLTGQNNGQETLEFLELMNLFLIPLDNERRWYRYHHLFADLLRQRLQLTQPTQLSILHLRASEWYEKNGLIEEAIKHALIAEDFGRAADLAESAWPEVHMNYQGTTWLHWVEGIPDELVRARPVLSTGYGWSLIDSGDLEGADLRLRDAERWLNAHAFMNERTETPKVRQAALDEEALRSLSGSVANARAYLTQALGDVPATEKYAQQALDLLPEDDHFERGLSAILRGFAYWSSGDLDSAHRAISEAISNMKLLGKIAFVISFSSYLADIMIAQGRLNEAKNTYLQLLDMAAKQGEPELPEKAVVYLGLSELSHEQGHLQAARRYLRKSEALGELPAFPPWYRHWVRAQTRIKETEGDLKGISKILNHSDRLYYRHPIPDIRPLKALMARARLAQGRLTAALFWVRERSLSVGDDLSYLREFEHLTLARVLIAQYKRDDDARLFHDAIGLLERLLKAAQEGKRMGSVIEIMALQALAYEAQGNISKALASLERALNLAEPEGYVRTFVSEGAPMLTLLNKMKPDNLRLKEYVSKLLSAFGEKEFLPPDTQPLIEPLSERELEVLQLIAEGLSNPEIAARLYLSLNTVKVHNRNIYGKLNVHSRIQAIEHSKALGLL